MTLGEIPTPLTFEQVLEQSPDTVPEGTAGGVVESVKTAVILALREGFSGTSMSGFHNAPAHISMEYPTSREQFPGIWVQFSFTSLQRAGVGHEVPFKDDDGNWNLLQEFRYDGRISMTISALTSLERDRIVDQIIAMLAFARGPQIVITNESQDTKQNRAFLSRLAQDPYVLITVNTDQVIPSGESTAQNTLPWDPDQLLYENTLAFTITGEFNLVFAHDGTYQLHRINVIPQRKSLTDWH